MDYNLWYAKEEFTLEEASFLWYGINPNDPITQNRAAQFIVPPETYANVITIAQILKEAQQKRELSPITSMSGGAKFSRTNLRSFAIKKGIPLPLFLLTSEERAELQTNNKQESKQTPTRSGSINKSKTPPQKLTLLEAVDRLASNNDPNVSVSQAEFDKTIEWLRDAINSGRLKVWQGDSHNFNRLFIVTEENAHEIYVYPPDLYKYLREMVTHLFPKFSSIWELYVEESNCAKNDEPFVYWEAMNKMPIKGIVSSQEKIIALQAELWAKKIGEALVNEPDLTGEDRNAFYAEYLFQELIKQGREHIEEICKMVRHDAKANKSIGREGLALLMGYEKCLETDLQLLWKYLRLGSQLDISTPNKRAWFWLKIIHNGIKEGGIQTEAGEIMGVLPIRRTKPGRIHATITCII